MESVRLRGHHLLCMLTWAGRGYTAAFTAKYDQVVKAIKEDAEIEIVAGPDDLCRALDPATTPDYHCTLPRIDTRDALALDALNTQLHLSLHVGSRLRVDENLLAQMRAHYKEENIRAGCFQCEFHDFCTDIAADDFACTRFVKDT